MYTRSWSAQILQIDRSAIWAIINDFHFFTYIINLMLILNEIKLRAYITGHRNDVFSLAGWGSDHILVHNSNHSPSAACKLLLAISSTHTSTSTHASFYNFAAIYHIIAGCLETESTKTGCTLSQERRIKHACLMLQPPLLQLSVAQNLLAEQEVVLDQDGRLLLPSPSLCRPGRGWRLCGGCCRVSWKIQHIFRCSLEMSIT